MESSNILVVETVTLTTCVKSRTEIIKGRSKQHLSQGRGESSSTWDPCLKKAQIPNTSLQWPWITVTIDVKANEHNHLLDGEINNLGFNLSIFLNKAWGLWDHRCDLPYADLDLLCPRRRALTLQGLGHGSCFCLRSSDFPCCVLSLSKRNSLSQSQDRHECGKSWCPVPIAAAQSQKRDTPHPAFRCSCTIDCVLATWKSCGTCVYISTELRA